MDCALEPHASRACRKGFSLLALGGLELRCLLLLLETLSPLLNLLLLHSLLRLLLRRQALLLLLGRTLHAALRKGLVAHELAVHALHGHFLRAPGLLDAVAVILVDLVVARMILRLGHGEAEASAGRAAKLEA